LHRALGAPAVPDFGENRSGPWLSSWTGHRAIGVVYHPDNEAANYVPTRMGGRYDALIWLEETTALRVLHHETRPDEPEFETAPSGF
jgi:erythromycin esterase-like protein